MTGRVNWPTLNLMLLWQDSNRIWFKVSFHLFILQSLLCWPVPESTVASSGFRKGRFVEQAIARTSLTKHEMQCVSWDSQHSLFLERENISKICSTLGVWVWCLVTAVEVVHLPLITLAPLSILADMVPGKIRENLNDLWIKWAPLLPLWLSNNTIS